MNYINDDIDYIWNLDSDELFKSKDIEKVIDFLKQNDPTSVGVRSCSFYGGFDHYLTGFELKRDNFLRIFKYEAGATWLTHRPPTIRYPENSNIKKRHIDSETLYNMLDVQMYHYSYVFPDQVFKKVSYYKDSVSKDRCIDNYFENVYLPWVTGDNKQRRLIEKMYRGAHEFKPEARGDCFTDKFSLEHPLSIQKNMSSLKGKFNEQLKNYA